jgi:hypothetical protein
MGCWSDCEWCGKWSRCCFIAMPLHCTGSTVGSCLACPPEANAIVAQVSNSANNPGRAYAACLAPTGQHCPLSIVLSPEGRCCWGPLKTQAFRLFLAGAEEGARQQHSGSSTATRSANTASLTVQPGRRYAKKVECVPSCNAFARRRRGQWLDRCRALGLRCEYDSQHRVEGATDQACHS